MADIVNPATRSRMMSCIRAKNTKPELTIRKALHSKGFRYKLHDKNLPGTPDLVFPKHKAVIFIHGCFWHGHDCSLFKMPTSNVEFWNAKIERNKANDYRALSLLLSQGWNVLTIWECSVKGKGKYSFGELISCTADWLTNPTPTLELRGK